ncbi:MAG: hypothetical protein ACYDCO_03940 [Armatimonadota bacterium]
MQKLFVLGFAVALACAAYAYPTLSGPTGLVTVPTAATVPAGQLQFAADWWSIAIVDSALAGRVLYGITDNIELGAIYRTEESDALVGDVWGVNAKLALPVTFGDAAWAIGAGYYDLSDVDESFFTANLAATREFNENFRGTANLLWSEDGLYQVLSGPGIFLIGGLNDSDFQLGVGAEATFENGLTVVGEYVNTLPGTTINVAARYPLTEALTAQLGYTVLDPIAFLGFNYAFGGTE